MAILKFQNTKEIISKTNKVSRVMYSTAYQFITHAEKIPYTSELQAWDETYTMVFGNKQFISLASNFVLVAPL